MINQNKVKLFKSDNAVNINYITFITIDQAYLKIFFYLKLKILSYAILYCQKNYHIKINFKFSCICVVQEDSFYIN